MQEGNVLVRLAQQLAGRSISMGYLQVLGTKSDKEGEPSTQASIPLWLVHGPRRVC